MTSIIELRAYDSDNSSLLALLYEATEIQYLAELRGTGAGSFAHPASTANAAYVVAGNVARVVIDNIEVGAFIMEQVEDDLLREGELMLRVTGRGILALFERAIVWPADTGEFYTAERTYLAKTFAYIAEDQIAEATARGVVLPSEDFSSTLDSGGGSWTNSYSLAYRSGSTLLEMIMQHGDLGVDVTTSADGTLHYWLAAGSDKSATVVLWEGSDIIKAGRITSHRDLANAVLGEGQYLFDLQTDAGSISSYGRRERMVQHGNVTDATQLAAFTATTLGEWAAPAVQIELVATDDNWAPLVDYGLGDTIAIRLTTAGLSASYRIRALALRQRDDGGADVTITLNTLIAEYRDRIDRALRRALMSPVETVQHGNSDPNVGGWHLSDTYLVYDTGTAATSAGLAPLDYPFYAGQVYSSRASAPFRVTAAGALTATSATITGTVTITGGSGIGNLSDAGALATASGVDWGTQVSGAGKPADNADVTSANTSADTSAVSGIASSSVAGWAHISDTTKIDGGDIYTGTVTAAKISTTTLAAIVADLGNITAGNIVVGTTNKLWLNDSADGALNIGGSTKASAPFRVTAAGALTATSATITGTVTITGGSGIGNLSDAGALATASGVDWGTQVSGAGKPADNADVTSANTSADTSAVSGIASSSVAGWAHISDTTKIDGGDIYTGTVTAAKISTTTLAAIVADLGNITAGNIVVGTTNKLWLNDSADGALNIGGSTKASAPFRVTAAGALTATSSTITGTINWGSGKGQLNSTGLSFNNGTNKTLHIDAASTDGLLRVKQDSATARVADFYQYGNADAVWITTVGTGSALVTSATADYAITAIGSSTYAIEARGNGGGIYGWVVGGSGRFGGHFESLLNGGTPIKLTNSATSSGKQFIWFTGAAANGSTNSIIVEESAVSTATRAGFLQVYVEDTGNQITDQNYFIPIYTLS